jgi:drug/metabolite transporter (DMT)-like permease
MNLLALYFIILSALFHSLWNVVLKTSDRKMSFNIFMHFSAITIFSVFFLLWKGKIPLPGFRLGVIAATAGFFFFLYHLCLTDSYETTEVSLAYPLTTTGPLYIPLWAYIFLGEKLSPLGGAGIVLVFFGAYTMQMKKLDLRGMLEPLRGMRNAGVLLALAAGFFYSIGAVVDKKGVSGFDVFTYTYYLDFALAIFLLCNHVVLRGKGSDLLPELRENWPKIVLAGAILFGSFLCYRLGLRISRVSYAVSTRQVSAIFGVVLGIVLFRESFGKIRLTGALLISLGVILIKFG